MTTAVAVQNQNHDQSKLDLIKKTVAKGSTDLELELFMHACKRTGLDPLMKQIYAIKRGDAMSFQTGIDGYRLIADRTGLYAGSEEPTYMIGDDGYPDVASVTVIKLVAGQPCKFSASARWGEYCQTGRDGKPTSMWQKMPFLMLGKCAEALALRKAFPAELSGVYTHEEMMQADTESAVEQARQSQKGKPMPYHLEVEHTAPATPPAAPVPVGEAMPTASPAPNDTTGSRADVYRMKIGRQKGQPVTDLDDENLQWAVNYYLDKIRDVPNSRFKDEWEEAVLALQEEKTMRDGVMGEQP